MTRRCLDTSPAARRRHHMDEALAAMRANGGCLVLRHGLFWTWPDCPDQDPPFRVCGHPYPAWCASAATIQDLLQNGLVFYQDREPAYSSVALP